ncbi:hypothetical protein HMPREF1549_01852 [Actinomyces johnsonii F0510]|uniref:Uncharacterized protein n=1 Tax=Actinomyces johnsonii F0510 TaxID=1227262 RepID=U1Q880_9ACTO|nr:hypothetical protein HMPREF1549_01852 [Actinomyces johnsonii F0510]
MNGCRSPWVTFSKSAARPVAAPWACPTTLGAVDGSILRPVGASCL